LAKINQAKRTMQYYVIPTSFGFIKPGSKSKTI